MSLIPQGAAFLSLKAFQRLLQLCPKRTEPHLHSFHRQKSSEWRSRRKPRGAAFSSPPAWTDCLEVPAGEGRADGRNVPEGDGGVHCHLRHHRGHSCPGAHRPPLPVAAQAPRRPQGGALPRPAGHWAAGPRSGMSSCRRAESPAPLVAADERVSAFLHVDWSAIDWNVPGTFAAGPSGRVCRSVHDTRAGCAVI